MHRRLQLTATPVPPERLNVSLLCVGSFFGSFSSTAWSANRVTYIWDNGPCEIAIEGSQRMCIGVTFGAICSAAARVNGTLNLTRVCQLWQLEPDPPTAIAAVPARDRLEERVGLRPAERQIADFVDDLQLGRRHRPVQGLFETSLPGCSPQCDDQVGGRREAHLPAPVRHRQMAVVAHIGPATPDIGLAFGQDGHGRVVTMQSLGGQDVRLATPEQRSSTAHPAPT